MFGRSKKELGKPPLAREKDAFEILRVWGGQGLPQQCAIKIAWEDPAAWGLLLVDIARHAAKAYDHAGHVDEGEALARIREAFNAEWDSPTDVPERIE